MKTQLVTLVSLVALAGSLHAATSLEQNNALKDVLRSRYIDRNTDVALKLAQAAVKIEADPEAQARLGDQIRDLGKGEAASALDRAIKFATGVKTEIYCAGVGLVEARSKHNDGSFSLVTLTTNNRKLEPGSYSVMTGGDWIYELSNSFRKPTNSDLIMTSGSKLGFDLKEVRHNADGRIDEGTFSGTWNENGKNSSNHSSSHGQVNEPIPMYMAIDYQHWGNRDLGYTLKFQEGYTDSVETGENATGRQRILLRTTREVGAKLANYSTTDSTGKIRHYKDCYPVENKISFKELEEQKPVFSGPGNQSDYVRVIESHSTEVQQCIDEAQKQDEGLRGTTTLAFNVDDQGKVPHARSAARDLGGNQDHAIRDRLDECIGGKLQTWSFPPAPKGDVVKMTYPFVVKRKPK